MATRHATRTVVLWAQYRTAPEGVHTARVFSGTWPDCIRYLNATMRHYGPRALFAEDTAGNLQPLMG